MEESLPSRERGLKYCNSGGVKSLSDVAPFAGAWIEICSFEPQTFRSSYVAPFAGAWIEISVFCIKELTPYVAPFAGAWIEISAKNKQKNRIKVAPFAGAWIEIFYFILYISHSVSLPSRERGLKSIIRTST